MQRVGENFRPVLLDFSGYNRDRFSDQRLDLRFLLAQHVDSATGVESADDDIDPCGPELPGHVEGPWKLVGLDSHQSDDKLRSGAPAPADNFFTGSFSAV